MLFIFYFSFVLFFRYLYKESYADFAALLYIITSPKILNAILQSSIGSSVMFQVRKANSCSVGKFSDAISLVVCLSSQFYLLLLPLIVRCQGPFNFIVQNLASSLSTRNPCKSFSGMRNCFLFSADKTITFEPFSISPGIGTQIHGKYQIPSPRTPLEPASALRIIRFWKMQVFYHSS